MLSRAGFLYRKTRGKTNDTTGLGAKTIVGQLSDYLTGTDFTARSCFQEITRIILIL